MAKMWALFLNILLVFVFLVSVINPVFAENTQPIYANVTVSASVPVKSADYPLQLTGPGNNVFGQDSVIGYSITYGSNLNFASNITIEATWDGGSQGVAEYMYGSATQTYNGIIPVVDLVNQKITWTINNFPSQTQNKVVYFALRTNDIYKGTSDVNFSVTAHIIASGLVTPNITSSKTYRYNSSTSQSSSSTTTPSTTTTTTSTTNYQPTVYAPTTSNLPSLPQFTPPPPTVFKNIFVSSISESDAKIFIELRGKYFPSVQFGTSPNSLTNKVTSLQSGKLHEMVLDQLQPETPYYFKVQAKDDKGKITGTETFIFKTAAISDKPDLEENTLIVSSGNNILTSPKDNNSSQTDQDIQTKLKQNNTVVVPNQTPYEIRFKLKRYQSIKQIKALLRLKNVLGISTIQAAEPSETAVELDEVEPGVYVGRLKSPPEAGNYEIIAKITDYSGNLIEKKVADVRVLKKMTVTDLAKQPIEDVRVFLHLFNTKTKTFQKISPLAMPIKNPSFSDRNGEVILTLPNGKYKAELSNLGYNDKTVEFTIGPNDEDGFPQVVLEKAPFNLLKVFRYHGRNIRDLFLANTLDYINSLVESLRVFDTLAAFSILFLIILTMLSFVGRTHISITQIPRFVILHLKDLFHKGLSNRVLVGKVVDDQAKQPISLAQIFIIDETNNNVVDQTTSNKLGEFYSKQPLEKNYHIMVIKKGYEPSPALAYPHHSESVEKMVIALKRSTSIKQTLINHISRLIINSLAFSLELLFVITLLFELLFLKTFGIPKTLPFLIISIANLFVWVLYLKRAKLSHHS